MSSRYCANCGDGIYSKCDFSSNSSWMFIFNLELVVGEMSERQTQLCQRCGFIFNDIYQSKIDFLHKTKGKSIMARFAVNTQTFNNNVDLNHNQDKMMQKLSCSVPKERDESINENDECIFSLSVDDHHEAMASSLPELDIVEMKELFPKLQIAKLDSATETNNFVSNAKDSLICTKCGRQFLTAERLSNHEAAVHSQNIWRYNCNFCDNSFQLEWFFKQHLKATHKGIQIQFECDICDDKFYNKKDLRSHKLQNHDIRTYPFNCNHCPESFDAISNLREHLTKEHSGSDEAAAAVSNLKLIEIWEKSNSRKYLSSSCFEKLQLGSEKFKCEMCGKQILRVPGLKAHYNSHLIQTRPFQYFCALCNRSYLYQKSYHRHMEKAHSNNINIVPHKCECGKTFENNNDLANHGKHCILFVTGIFSCDKCNKKFKSSTKFDIHKNWHTIATYASKGARRKHLPPNFAKFTIPDGTNEIDFTLCFLSQSDQYCCPVNACRRLYQYKSTLVKHLKTAHDIRGLTECLGKQAAVEIPTIKCSDCPRLFSRKDTRNAHYNRYHRKLEHHTCLVCDKQYEANQIMQHYNRHTVAVSSVTSCSNTRLETNLKDLNHWYNVETQRYECSINSCVSKFRLKSEFLNHCTTTHEFNISIISIAMPKFDFLCTRHDCSKSYPTKVQLREHLKFHKRKNRKLKS